LRGGLQGYRSALEERDMNDETAFLAAIHAAPEDDNLRLV